MQLATTLFCYTAPNYFFVFPNFFFNYFPKLFQLGTHGSVGWSPDVGVTRRMHSLNIYTPHIIRNVSIYLEL